MKKKSWAYQNTKVQQKSEQAVVIECDSFFNEKYLMWKS